MKSVLFKSESHCSNRAGETSISTLSSCISLDLISCCINFVLAVSVSCVLMLKDVVAVVRCLSTLRLDWL